MRLGSASVGALGALALLLAASDGRGQAPPQVPPPPVFGAGVDLVRLDVVVLDKDDRPVTGLSREDFVVEEEGRRQTVESFEPVIVRGGRPATPDEPPRLTGARLRAPSEGRCLLIFIDDIHVSPPTMERVRASLRRFLETDVREGDWVTVVAPEQQLWWTARNAWEYTQLAGVVGRLTGQGKGDSSGDWAAVRALEYGLPPVGGTSAVMAGGSGTSGGPGQFAVVGRPDAPVFSRRGGAHRSSGAPGSRWAACSRRSSRWSGSGARSRWCSSRRVSCCCRRCRATRRRSTSHGRRTWRSTSSTRAGC